MFSKATEYGRIYMLGISDRALDQIHGTILKYYTVSSAEDL